MRSAEQSVSQHCRDRFIGDLEIRTCQRFPSSNAMLAEIVAATPSLLSLLSRACSNAAPPRLEHWRVSCVLRAHTCTSSFSTLRIARVVVSIFHCDDHHRNLNSLSSRFSRCHVAISTRPQAFRSIHSPSRSTQSTFTKL